MPQVRPARVGVPHPAQGVGHQVHGAQGVGEHGHADAEAVRRAQQPGNTARVVASYARVMVGEAPIVVPLYDLVTGSFAVVPAEEVPTILDVWFPNLTSEARALLDRLKERAEADDWRMAERYGHCLKVEVRPMSATLPTQRRSSNFP